MSKKINSISVKLTLIFIVFLLVSLLLVGVTTYFSQTTIYKQQCLDTTRQIGEYLTGLIQRDGEDFVRYQKYYLEHYSEVDIPIDADEYVSYRTAFLELFAKTYPGKTLDVDIRFEELNDEVKHAYLKFRHLYWLTTFESAREVFHLPYSYYLVLDSDTDHVIYMIDGERSSRAGHLEFITENPQYRELHHEQGSEAEYMYLNDEYYDAADLYPVQWETWETGEKQDDFQVWNNAWGHTYAYYVPLVINGEKLGLIGVEVAIADYNAGILSNTITQLSVVAVVMMLALAVLVFLINRKYIRKIIRLEANVKDYSVTRDVEIADEIEKHIRGNDEISSLSEEIVVMIRRIQDYIHSLLQTTQELDRANDNVVKMSVLAHKDSLTGIRNRNGYDEEVHRLEKELESGKAQFAIAMIDLNNLKRMNDTYGHEKGNITIKKLCDIVCRVFEHSPVFRIGGDEFVVVIKNEDFLHRDELVELFLFRLRETGEDPDLSPWERISAAIGVAVYDPKTDKDVEAVFKRADDLMYECKKKMKAQDADAGARADSK